MNGVHDVGGMQDMGPVQIEKNEPVFHAPWEGRVYAIRQVIGRKLNWNGYTFRYQRQLIPAADHLRMSYYERWFVGMIELLVKTGVVTRQEVESGRRAAGSPANYQPPPAAPAREEAPLPPRFKVGQRVRTRNINPITLTQLPRYARGRIGMIERDRGVFSFPDTAAHGLGDNPQHVYSIRFAARELWGEQAAPQDSVYLDLWDSHLETT
jgi:nitrile hydratase subunit beta